MRQPTTALSTDRLLTLKEFRKRIAHTDAWVRNQVKRGAIPAVRLGRELRFRESTLIQLMNRGLPAYPADREPEGCTLALDAQHLRARGPSPARARQAPA